jgi:hypothetical protein
MPIYGLDLITDADGPLIEPDRHQITQIGLSRRAEDELYEGGEPELLELLDRRLKLLPRGVLATWHGSVLAVPLIAQRAERWKLSLGLTLWVDRRAAPLSPVAGVDTAYCASWHDHALLDLRRVYETSEPKRWSIRGRSRPDPEDLIPTPDELTQRDPLKDARLARQLAERRWSQAKRCVDTADPRNSDKKSGQTVTR